MKIYLLTLDLLIFRLFAGLLCQQSNLGTAHRHRTLHGESGGKPSHQIEHHLCFFVKTGFN